jgi:hypothetical protein
VAAGNGIRLEEATFEDWRPAGGSISLCSLSRSVIRSLGATAARAEESGNYVVLGDRRNCASSGWWRAVMTASLRHPPSSSRLEPLGSVRDSGPS